MRVILTRKLFAENYGTPSDYYNNQKKGSGNALNTVGNVGLAAGGLAGLGSVGLGAMSLHHADKAVDGIGRAVNNGLEQIKLPGVPNNLGTKISEGFNKYAPESVKGWANKVTSSISKNAPEALKGYLTPEYIKKAVPNAINQFAPKNAKEAADIVKGYLPKGDPRTKIKAGAKALNWLSNLPSGTLKHMEGLTRLGTQTANRYLPESVRSKIAPMTKELPDVGKNLGKSGLYLKNAKTVGKAGLALGAVGGLMKLAGNIGNKRDDR